MARLELSQVKRKISPRFMVEDVSFVVDAGALTVLLGPSGCGKSSTLRMIAGLDKIDAGKIQMGERTVSAEGIHVSPGERNVSMVFQNLALWPHMRAVKQLRFVLKGAGLARKDRETRIARYLDMVGLSDRRRSYPHQLSGGELQRLALARALVVEPSLVLLDEPLSAADRSLRGRLQKEIRSIQKQLEIPMVYVTHDQEEALALADRIVVMQGGRVEQIGTPRDVYERPKNRFVATFLGSNNVLQGTKREGDFFDTVLGPVVCPAGDNGLTSGLLSLRPEALSVHEDGVECVVEASTYQGGRWLTTVSREGQYFMVFSAVAPDAGSRIRLQAVGEGFLLQGDEDGPGT